MTHRTSILLALALSGCGESVSTFCTSYVTALATLEAKCSGGPPSDWQTYVGKVVDCSELEAAVNAGRVNFQSGNAGGCISAINALTCTASPFSGGAEPTACVQTLQGTVEVAGSCYSNADCVTGHYCAIPSGACTGVCTGLLAAGASCDFGAQCVSGYECQASASTVTCTAVPTPTYAEQGMPCGYDQQTGLERPCAGGLGCDTQTQVCQPLIGQGANCMVGTGLCGYFLACGSEGICDPWPSNSGAACGAVDGGDPVGCLGSLYCDLLGGTNGTGTCQPPIAGGMPCTTSQQCVSGSCTAGTCPATCSQL